MCANHELQLKGNSEEKDYVKASSSGEKAMSDLFLFFSTLDSPRLVRYTAVNAEVVFAAHPKANSSEL